MPEDMKEHASEIVEPWLAEDTPLGRAGFPLEIANAALWLASSESSFVTGHVLTIDGGLTADRPRSQMLRRFEQLKERFQSALGPTSVSS